MEISLTGASGAADVAARRAEKVAALDARQAERAAARDERRSGMASVQAADGSHVNVARSSDEFWALFNAGDAALRREMDAAVGAAAAAPLAEPAAVALANAWTERVAALQDLLNDSSRFLAAFDVRGGAEARARCGGRALRRSRQPRARVAARARCAATAARSHARRQPDTAHPRRCARRRARARR
jgi:hypothetical protein